MDDLAAVTAITRKLNLLDESGVLVRLDSLSILDLVAEIEDGMDVSIPTERITPASFATLQAIATLVQGCRPGGA